MKLLMLAAALLILPVRNAHANLIVNGGFEDPDIPTGSWAVFGAIPGWTTTAGPGIEIQDNVAGSPYEGGQFVELDSYGNSWMLDNGGVTTVVGQLYNLSFAFSPRPSVGSTSNGIELWIDGAFTDYLTGNGAANTVWTVHNYAVAGDGATQIEFRAVGVSDSYGGYIDDVQFDAANPQAPVPEPASLILTALGLVTSGAVRRARRQQA